MTHWFRTGTREFPQDGGLTICNKITESFNVFNFTSFYFLASVWKFGSYKTKEKEEDKTQKTTKMRRGTIEEKAEEKYDEIRLIRVETVVVCLRTSNIHLDAYSRA